jgi:hypothetical protein
VFIDFGTTFQIEDRDYWEVVLASLQETMQDMKVKDLLTVVSQLKQFGLLTNTIIKQAISQVQ